MHLRNFSRRGQSLDQVHLWYVSDQSWG